MLFLEDTSKHLPSILIHKVDTQLKQRYDITGNGLRNNFLNDWLFWLLLMNFSSIEYECTNW